VSYGQVRAEEVKQVLDRAYAYLDAATPAELVDKKTNALITNRGKFNPAAIAHGVNQGWLDAQAYGPLVLLAWSAVSTKVTKQGQVSNRAEVNVSNLERHAELVEASRPLRQGRSTKRARCFDKLSMTTFLLWLLLLEYLEGTCVGTGMGFDPAFYYYRPVNVYAAHGYGPVLLAGAEITQLLKQHPYGINRYVASLESLFWQVGPSTKAVRKLQRHRYARGFKIATCCFQQYASRQCVIGHAAATTLLAYSLTLKCVKPLSLLTIPTVQCKF